jgi:hypothetical protein
MFNRGGQRRTIEAGCGWRCVGHPNEVDSKYKIHKKFCNTCKDNNFDIPKFNRTNGDINGWKGNKLKPNQNKEIATSCIVKCEKDGRQINKQFTIRHEANSIEDSFKKINDTLNEIKEEKKILNEEKKKRCRVILKHLLEMKKNKPFGDNADVDETLNKLINSCIKKIKSN